MGRYSVHERAVPAFLALFQTSFRTRGLTSRLPQWCALAVVALVDAIWAWRSGFHIIVTFGDFALPAGIVALAVAFHLFRQGKAALMTEYLALTLSMALAFTVLAVFVGAIRAGLRGGMDPCRFRHTHRIVLALMVAIVVLAKLMFYV